MLCVPFKLRKPYLSKDDRTFHLLDNPVRKDKVFQTPMVASTSWKGALHSAMVQQLAAWWCNLDGRDSRNHRKELVARRISIGRLFGTEKGIQIDSTELESYLDSLGDKHLAHWYRRYIRRYFSSSGFFSGRLYFYPTFFDKIGLEVINPHDRKTGVGKNPILIESVPIGATGILVILYVPFGKVERIQVAEDLKLTAEGVEAMLTVYGFGAKTSSGFGVAEDQLYRQGELAINHSDAPQISLRPQEPEYPESLRLFLENNPNEDFQLKPKEWRKLHNASQSQRESYQDARNARSTYQNALNVYESELARWEVQANTPPLPKTERNFNTLDQLVTKAKELEQQLIGDSSHD
jgi:CRISPR-associated protein Cmr2